MRRVSSNPDGGRVAKAKPAAEAHGGAAMKGVANFTTKGLACVATGVGCTSLGTEATAESALTVTGIAQDTGGTLVWNDGTCTVTATITADGGVTYAATLTSGATGATAAQCVSGAGL